MIRRVNIPTPVVWAVAVVGGGALFVLAGIGVYSLAGSGGGGASTTVAPLPSATRAESASPSSAATATAVPATATASLAPTLAPVATAPPPTATPDFTAQPAVEVLSVAPPLGTHIETASVDIALNVRYQAGRDSNVLAWTLLYCASPNDCNTYGSQSGLDVVPGSAGTVTLGTPFAAGGNYLRPIVVCQYTVEIAHFLTPEARWQSQLANDARCHPAVTSPRIKVLDVKPALGAVLAAGDVVRVNIEYDAGPATKAQVRYSVERCAGDLFAVGTVAVVPGTSGIATIEIRVGKLTGALHHVEAQLLNGDQPVANYNFGPC